MKCLLVFDYSNDIIYTKYNKKFANHINQYAKSQGLLSEEFDNPHIGLDIIVQIFSPMVTSQRIMSCQFGNSYTSIQCQDGLNLAFEEYMGYLFVSIGMEDVATMKRFLSVCVTIVRYFCGADVQMLKSNQEAAFCVTRTIDSWLDLYSVEQLMLVESVEQLVVNSDLSSTTLQALQEVVEKFHCLIDCPKTHALVLVRNKFLGLYSSRNATPLSAADILFLILVNNMTYASHSRSENDDTEASDEEYYETSSSAVFSMTSESNSESNGESDMMHSYKVLLTGPDSMPKCLPHLVHISSIGDHIDLLLIIENGNASISSNLYETFFHLNTIQSVQMQREAESLRPAFEKLDSTIKKLCDSLKKSKNSSVDSYYKQLTKKWEVMRKKYLEFLKSGSGEALVRAESYTMGLLDTLKELFHQTSYDEAVMEATTSLAKEVTSSVRDKMKNFTEFLGVKALRNFTLGSDSLTINKYLEEFPGLVHFLYIDRTCHRLTAPSLDFSSEETVTLTKRKIWSMIDFSRNHLQEGHLSIMWKDTTFNYAYFLWFEDNTGAPLKPTIFPTNASKALSQPGIFCGDFYQKLKEVCFPKMSHTKIRCYELFCIHLGLATASCVLEHTRRLAATIWEIRGHPNHALDIL